MTKLGGLQSGDNQSQQPSQWAPHDLANYDETLARECATEVRRLATATSQERLSFIIDPREVHARLYTDLSPEKHPEYAGTFRGTPGTSLEGRRCWTCRDDDKSYQEFVSPDRVLQHLRLVEDQARKVFELPPQTSSADLVSEIVRLFYIFGLIHPFLDGNGHIQRLIFAACVVERSSLRLSEAWTIHPRPYDVEIKRAFEAPTLTARLAALRSVLAAYVSG